MTILKPGYLRWDGSKYLTDSNINVPLGGDVSGNNTGVTVVGIQGRSVSSALPTDGFVLSWNAASNSWIPASPGSGVALAGDVTGTAGANTVVKIQGNPVSATAPTTNYVLAWNGTQWISTNPTSLTAGSVSPGTAGQFYITNGGPASAWTSALTVDSTAYTGNAVLQLAGGTQATVALGAIMSSTGHIRSPQAFVWRARNNANNNDITLLQFSTDSLAFGGSNSSIMSFTSGAQTTFNAGTYMQMAVPTVYIATALGTSTIQITPDPTTTHIDFIQTTNANIILDAATSNVPTGTLTIRGQYAFGTALGANQTPGNVVLDIGAPTNGGTTEGKFSFTRNGVEIANIQPIAGSTTGELFLTGFGVMYYSSNVLNLLATNNIQSSIGGTVRSSLSSTGLLLGTHFSESLLLDWTTGTTPLIQATSTSTSLTVSTNGANAALNLKGGTGVTGITVTAPGSTAGTANTSLTGSIQNTIFTPIATPYTIDGTTTDTIIHLTGLTLSAQSVTLPAPTAGRMLEFWLDLTGGSAVDCAFTFARHAAERINGVAGNLVVGPYTAGSMNRLMCKSDGTNWFIAG